MCFLCEENDSGGHSQANHLAYHSYALRLAPSSGSFLGIPHVEGQF